MASIRKLAPSLLASDPGHMARDMALAEAGGAKLWHLDIMDGHFVPNLSFGPYICEGLRKHSALPMDAHLMVKYPSRFIEPFIKAGAALVNIHVETETTDILHGIIDDLMAHHIQPAMTLKPTTPLETILPFLPKLSMVLLMGVEPGYGGQTILPHITERITALRGLMDKHNPTCDLEIDGGVTLDNLPELLKAGANVIVAGSAVFGAADIQGRCEEFCGIMDIV